MKDLPWQIALAMFLATLAIVIICTIEVLKG